eukprot:1845448-Pyramimonas_sp.AAC.1
MSRIDVLLLCFVILWQGLDQIYLIRLPTSCGYLLLPTDVCCESSSKQGFLRRIVQKCLPEIPGD